MAYVILPHNVATVHPNYVYHQRSAASIHDDNMTYDDLIDSLIVIGNIMTFSVTFLVSLLVGLCLLLIFVYLRRMLTTPRRHITLVRVSCCQI